MKATHGRHFSAAEAGPLRNLGQYSHPHPKLGAVRGKLFLKGVLGLTSMEVSLGKMGPGAGLPFFHRHREHEELYIIVGGRGQFQIDDQVLDVREGSVIRVAPGGTTRRRTSPTSASRQPRERFRATRPRTASAWTGRSCGPRRTLIPITIEFEPRSGVTRA
jgi:hypothetical protein